MTCSKVSFAGLKGRVVNGAEPSSLEAGGSPPDSQPQPQPAPDHSTSSPMEVNLDETVVTGPTGESAGSNRDAVGNAAPVTSPVDGPDGVAERQDAFPFGHKSNCRLRRRLTRNGETSCARGTRPEMVGHPATSQVSSPLPKRGEVTVSHKVALSNQAQSGSGSN